MVLYTHSARREWRRIRRARRAEERLFSGRPMDAEGILRRESRCAALWALLALWAAVFGAALWMGVAR